MELKQSSVKRSPENMVRVSELFRNRQPVAMADWSLQPVARWNATEIGPTEENTAIRWLCRLSVAAMAKTLVIP